MIRKKKAGIMAAILATMLTASVFTGCGNKDKDNANNAGDNKKQEEKVTVEFWTISLQPTFTDFFNDLIKKYEGAHPNVKVNWTDMPYDAIQNKLITSVAGNTAPDVVNLNTGMALTLAGKGALVDLNKEATEEQKSIYIKTLWESAKLNDSVYAFPWYGAPSILMYNKELLDKAGVTPPKTFDEMLSVAKQVKDKTGAYIYIPEDFTRMLFLNGLDIVNADKSKAAFNTPEAVELLNKYKKAVEDGSLPKTGWGKWDEMLKQFSTKKLAMINSGAQTLKRIKDEAPDVYKNIEVTTPIVGKTGQVLNPIMNIVVPEASKHHKEAIDFANFVTNDENQLAFCKTVQIFPSTSKAAQDPFFRQDKDTVEGKALSIVADELEKSADLTIGLAKEGDIFTVINKAAESVILGGKDAKAALDQAEKDVNNLLSQK